MYFPIISTAITGIYLGYNYINRYNAYRSSPSIVSPCNTGEVVLLGKHLVKLGLEDCMKIYGAVATNNLCEIIADHKLLEELAGRVYNPVLPIFFDFSYKVFSSFVVISSLEISYYNILPIAKYLDMEKYLPTKMFDFENIYQVGAFNTGRATPEEALRFNNSKQVYALRAGEASAEEVLKVNDDTLKLLILGKVTAKEALQFDNIYQIDAFNTGKATVEEALQFKNIYQILALKTGKTTVEEALQFKYNLQLIALNTGKFTAEEILENKDFIKEDDLVLLKLEQIKKRKAEEFIVEKWGQFIKSHQIDVFEEEESIHGFHSYLKLQAEFVEEKNLASVSQELLGQFIDSDTDDLQIIGADAIA